MKNNQLRERVDALENRPVVENTVRVASEPRIMERRAAAKSATIAGSGGQVASLTADDYLREWTLALAERDPLKRSMMVSRLLAGVTAANAPSVAAIFDRAGTTGASYGAELAVFMRVWGKVDGPTALEHVVNLEGGVTGSAMMQAAVAGWATANPHGAREWVETLDEGANKEELIVGLLDGWATSDLDGASRYAETRPRTPARNRMRKMLMERALVSGGIQGAQQWFYGVSGEGHNRMYKQLALDELTQKIVRQDPAAAARWLKQQDGEPHLGGRAITATAAELSKRSPTDALAFVDSLEHMKNGQMTSVYSQVMRSWAEQDPAAAGAWLNQNPEHPRYDAVASRYIMAIAEVDPAAALKWANSITKEHKRHNGLLIAGAGMLAQYGEAAIPQLKAAGFTDEMIEAAPKQRAWAEAHPDSEKMQGITVGNDGVIIVGQGPNGYEQRAATPAGLECGSAGDASGAKRELTLGRGEPTFISLKIWEWVGRPLRAAIWTRGTLAPPVFDAARNSGCTAVLAERISLAEHDSATGAEIVHEFVDAELSCFQPGRFQFAAGFLPVPRVWGEAARALRPALGRHGCSHSETDVL